MKKLLGLLLIVFSMTSCFEFMSSKEKANLEKLKGSYSFSTIRNTKNITDLSSDGEGSDSLDKSSLFLSLLMFDAFVDVYIDFGDEGKGSLRLEGFLVTLANLKDTDWVETVKGARLPFTYKSIGNNSYEIIEVADGGKSTGIIVSPLDENFNGLKMFDTKDDTQYFVLEKVMPY